VLIVSSPSLFCQLSLFQNPVGFEPGSWKNRQKPGFSTKFKETVPKTEFLEQPQFPYQSGLVVLWNLIQDFF
jgi:hypothetical protein